MPSADPDAVTLVPIHPEPVAGDALEMRWVVPAETLSFVGETEQVPGVLRELLDDGTLTSVSVDSAAVRTRLAPARSWRTEGARVRTALQGALAVPQEWSPRHSSSPDDILRAAVHEVITGEVGDFVRSHGGEIALVEVRDGVVSVSMNGACAHCPASRLTLGDRFETALRSRFPALRAVQRVDSPAASLTAGGRRRLPLLVSRARRG